MTKLSKLDIKFNDLWKIETFAELLWTSIPTESIAEVLKAFYAYKLGTYVNDQNYEWIRELDGILELHNLVVGKKDK